MAHRPRGPFGVDPLHFSLALFILLILFVLYLLLPRAMRKQYFGAYPKRHAWSARARGRRGLETPARGSNYAPQSTASYVGASSLATGMTGPANARGNQMATRDGNDMGVGGQYHNQTSNMPSATHPAGSDAPHNDEIVISAAMQQLRDPGVLIVAHGSRGKPKTVRLQLTETAITWRTETRKKSKMGSVSEPPKMGKLHQVPLSHIMYVDVGKQTTALRRVENAAVSEALCFSLLTKEGSLDLEANSPRERDALVSCFSLVLDEVHAQNWRDIYRGPSTDVPSSFDEGNDEK